jgi:Flp pilus assembly protein TadG
MLSAAFRRDRCAVAALEFGLLAPVMAIMTVAVFDLSKAGIIWEQTRSAARSIAESASTVALQPDGSTSLTTAQAQEALSIIFAEMPLLRAGIATGATYSASIPGNTVSAVLTGVSYQPTVSTCSTACTYAATVRWSKAYSGYNFITGTSVLRPCGTLTPTRPTAPQTLATAPISALGTALSSTNANEPDPFLIADVSFKYTPFFFRYLTGAVTFRATIYWTSRSSAVAANSSNWTLYPAAADPASVSCSYPS